MQREKEIYEKVGKVLSEPAHTAELDKLYNEYLRDKHLNFKQTRQDWFAQQDAESEAAKAIDEIDNEKDPYSDLAPRPW